MQDWAGLNSTEWAALLSAIQQQSYLRCSDLANNKKNALFNTCCRYTLRIVRKFCEKLALS